MLTVLCCVFGGGEAHCYRRVGEGVPRGNLLGETEVALAVLSVLLAPELN